MKDYIIPSPKSLLNYDFGLTSTEIAQSLGVTNREIVKKIKKKKWSKNTDWKWKKTEISVFDNGVKSPVYVLDVFSSCLIVGQWISEKADGYLNHLFDVAEALKALEMNRKGEL